MFYISEQQIEVMRKRFWLFLLLALLFLAVLLLVPRGELARNPESDSWTNIMPSGLFEPNEDGTSYGYKDQCGSDARCRSCKANIACLDCMNKCYNRYGPFYKKDNPRLAGAMLCSSECVVVAEKRNVEADLRFANPKGKK